MAEFLFFANREESKLLVQSAIFDLNLEVILDTYYDSLHIPTLQAWNETVDEFLSVGRTLYITGRFTTSPVGTIRLSKGAHEGKYSVYMNEGGQLLSLSLPITFRRAKLLRLTQGCLYRPRSYWNAEKSTVVKPSSETIAAYDAVQKAIKRHVKRRELGGTAIWTSEQAWDLLNEGKALMRIKGRWFDKTGKIVDPVP